MFWFLNRSDAMAKKTFDLWRKLLLYVFCFFGFIYTIIVISSNIALYFEYQSTFIQISLDDVHAKIYNKVNKAIFKPYKTIKKV